MIKKMKENQKGFTLVELVVVIAILAVLALLIVPRIMGNVGDAKRSSALADARTIASEVTTHNALVAIGDEGDVGDDEDKKEPITAQGENNRLLDSDLKAIEREKDGILAKAAEEKIYVVVDADGNASVVEDKTKADEN